MSKAGSNYTCLAIINVDSAFKKDKNYYPQVLLKECKYIENKLIRYIIEDPNNTSNESNEPDEE